MSGKKKPAPRVILFYATTAEAAKQAAAAFSAITQKLGMAWEVRSAGVNEGPLLGDVNALVVWKELSFGIKDWPGKLVDWPGGEVESAASKIVARLMGGSDGPESPDPPAGLPLPKKPAHTVKLGRETAGRHGKGVTVVWELPLSEEQLKDLCTQLKNKCGTGGTAKAGRIEIQGDQRDKIEQELIKLGYKVKRSGG